VAETPERFAPGALGHSVVPLDQGLLGVREPVELEVVVVVDELGQALQHLRQRHRLLAGVQQERRDALQRHLGDDAQRAEADPGGAEPGVLLVDLDDLAVGGDQLHADHGGRDAVQLPAGAVRAGRRGPGHRLRVDVAQVGQGQPQLEQPGVELVQRDAGLDAHPPGSVVMGEHVVHPVEAEQEPVGRGDRGERVPGAVGLDGQALRPRHLDQLHDLGGRLGVHDASGMGGDAAAPAGPGLAHPKLFPSPR
jgi:hypothetical protein